MNFVKLPPYFHSPYTPKGYNKITNEKGEERVTLIKKNLSSKDNGTHSHHLTKVKMGATYLEKKVGSRSMNTTKKNPKFLLKNHLTFGMTLLFTLALVSMFFFINTEVRNIIHNHVVTVAMQDSRFHTSQIDGWFRATTQRVKDMARILEALPDSELYPDIMESFMSESEIDNSFIGFSDGSNINGVGWVPPEGWVSMNSPWYGPAKEAGENEVIITGPYLSLSTQEIAVSIATYIQELNGLNAVVGTQIAIDFISDLIAYYSDANDGYLILVGSNNEIITHPKGFAPTKEGEFYHLDEIPGGSFYIELMMGQEEAMEFKDSYIGRAYVIRNNLESIDWTLISIISVETIQDLVTKYTSSIMTVIAVVLITLLVVIAFIMQKLNVASAKALEANQAKTTFFSNMNHEIRTPMNAILGMAEIGKKSKDEAVKNHSFKRIEEASTHLLGLINDVLDMSKIEAGKFELYNEEFEFENMIHKVMNLMESSILQKSQTLSVSIDSQIPKYIIADEQKLMQAIANLLSNAVKFTPSEGAIRLSAYHVQEEHGLYTIKIEVMDTGAGIPEELLPKLFDSYERADNEIARKAGGTGLGLPITKRIVELFQGEIWVESELDKGSTISFTIKVSGMREIKTITKQEIQEYVDENVDENSFKGSKLLIVEDIEINREIIIALLEETEIEIECAENGKEALEKFAKSSQEYDLIFMDLNMPEMDGITASRKIRASNFVNAQTVPIVALTADVFQTTIDECMEAGMNDYISKPLNSTIILEKLKKYLK